MGFGVIVTALAKDASVIGEGANVVTQHRVNIPLWGDKADPLALRIVERHGNSFHVIREGKFSYLLIYNSNALSDNVKNELKEVGIETISFQKQKNIKDRIKELKEENDVDVDAKNDGDYKDLEPL